MCRAGIASAVPLSVGFFRELLLRDDLTKPGKGLAPLNQGPVRDKTFYGLLTTGNSSNTDEQGNGTAGLSSILAARSVLSASGAAPHP